MDKPISAHEADEDEFPGIKETANYILSQFNNFTQARGFRASAMFALKVCTLISHCQVQIRGTTLFPASKHWLNLARIGGHW